MDQTKWESSIKKRMENKGWTFDHDTESTLGFSFVEGEFHWMRDYNKKNRRFVQFNGNQIVNLVVTENEVAK